MHHGRRALMRLCGAACASALAGLTAPAAAAAQMRSWEWRGEWHPMGVWAFGMFVMFLTFWGLVIAGAIIGLRWLLRGGRREADDPAVGILRERYARGEIGKEEFETKLRDLRQHR